MRTDTVIRGEGQHGAVPQPRRPARGREFTYVRRGSFGSTLQPDDLDPDLLAATAVVTASGIATAMSDSAAALVERAAAAARCFVYDPNFRPRLTTAEPRRRHARPARARTARSSRRRGRARRRHCSGSARRRRGRGRDRLRALGARGRRGHPRRRGSLVAAGPELTDVPVVPAPQVVDQTGAGDSMTGTLCARLAAGDGLVDAVRLGAAAASLSVGALGGTGLVPTLDRIRAHRGAHAGHRLAAARLATQGASS